MGPTSYRSSSPRSALFGSVLVAGLLTGAPTVAQNVQAQAVPAGALEEVVVTAQFRQQKLQDTPIAITAVDAALLEARNQTNLAQVADSAPNVTFRPQGASFGPSITAYIRGVGQNDFTPAYEPGVGIYIDDVYFPSLTGAVFDLLDLDRVEILRGPQGTLAGRNSEGGAIKMYSIKPTGVNGGSVEATAGSRDRIGLRASGDFAISDTVSARISGVFKKQNGYVDQIDFGCAHPAGSDPLNPAGGVVRTHAAGDCVVGKLGGIGYEAARAIVRVKPNDNFDLLLSADATHDAHTIPGEVLLRTGPVYPFTTNPVTSNPAVIVPYDSRFICGQYCNYATMSQPAINFVALPLFPGGPTLTPPGGQPLLATFGSNISVYDSYDLGANLHWNLSDALSIDNILAYQHFKTTWDSDDDLSPVNTNLGHNIQTHWNWSEELRLNAKLANSVNAVFGVYYFKQETDYWSYQDIRYIPVFPLQFIQPDTVPADSKAVFANVGWEITQNLNLNAGLRYTKESKEYHYFRLNPDGITANAYVDPVGAVYGIGYNGPDTLGLFGGGTVTALSGSVAHYEGSKTDYRAALDYRFSPEAMVYGSVSTGFKGGGTNPRPFYADQVISFNPETLTNFELGIKSDLLNRHLRLNLAVFYEKIKDVQIPVLACPDSPCAARVNAGDAESKGVEVELEARPTDALSIDASYSYLNFHFTSLVPSAEYPTNPAGATLDDPAAGVPKQKFTLGMQYEIALGNSGSLTPRIDASYQDKIYTGFPSVEAGVRTLLYLPSYTLANARVTWRNAKKDVDVALECTNLTDKYYYLSNFDLTGLGAGFDKVQPGRPREWAITFKKKFGTI
jgi:iron complex outermembrane recepter protein